MDGLMSEPRPTTPEWGQSTASPPKKPPKVTQEQVDEELEKEKERLVRRFVKKKQALDARGIFNSSVNTVRAENMLISAMSKITRSQLEKKAMERVGHDSDNTPVQTSHKLGRNATMADRLERRLNDMYTEALTDKVAEQEAERKRPQLKKKRRPSGGQPTIHRKKPVPVHSFLSNDDLKGNNSQLSDGSPGRRVRGSSFKKGRILDYSSPEPTTGISAVTPMSNASANPSMRTLNFLHPDVIARREASARHASELQASIVKTQKKAISTKDKLMLEEANVYGAYKTISNTNGIPPVQYSVADFMQKAWEHKGYPEEAVVADKQRVKKIEKKYGTPRAASSATTTSPRTAMKVTDGVAPTAKQIWDKQAAHIHASRLVQTPSLVEASGYIKTVTPPPLLPPPVDPKDRANWQSPAQEPPAKPKEGEKKVTEGEAPESPEKDVMQQSVSMSPHARKYPNDLKFKDRTARATTLVQREFKKHMHDSLVEQQSSVHPMYRLPEQQPQEHMVDVDEWALNSDSDSEKDEEEDQSHIKDNKPGELGDEPAQILEDVIIFLCREFDRKKRGKNRGRKDVTVMRNILMQSLKLLLPVINQLPNKGETKNHTLDRDREESIRPSSLEDEEGFIHYKRKKDKASVVITPSMARALRSWTKGVEVLISWDLETDGPFNPHNEDHVYALADYYGKQYRRINKRVKGLMHQWKDQKIIQDEERRQAEKRMYELLGLTDQARSEELIRVREARRKEVSDYLEKIAADNTRPESKSVLSFLERFNIMKEVKAPEKKNRATNKWRDIIFNTMGVMKGWSVEERDKFLGNLLKNKLDPKPGGVNIFMQAVGGVALLQGTNSVSRMEQKERMQVLMNNDLLNILNKYVKMSSMEFQASFREAVIEIKHNILSGKLRRPDEITLPDDEPTELIEKQKHSQELEKLMAVRLMEVERDRLIKKYAREYRDNEAKISKFYDVLSNTDVWSTQLRSGFGDAGSLFNDEIETTNESAAIYEREKKEAERYKAYENFQKVQVKRLDTLTKDDTLQTQARVSDSTARRFISVGPQTAVRSPPHHLSSMDGAFGGERPSFVQSLKDMTGHTPVPLRENSRRSSAEQGGGVTPPDTPTKTVGADASLSGTTLQSLKVGRLKDLDTIWNALKLEFQPRMDLYDKYDGKGLQDLDQAINLWRKASEAILRREAALKTLKEFEEESLAKLSNLLPGEFPPLADKAEEQARARMFADFCKAGLQCETVSRRMEVDLGDSLTFDGMDYLDKMRTDYAMVLAMLEKSQHTHAMAVSTAGIAAITNGSMETEDNEVEASA